MVVAMTKPQTRIALWAGAAVAAVAIASAAIGAAVGAGPAALSEQEIADRLAATGSTPTSTTGPSSSGTMSPSAAGPHEILRTIPGTIVATCTGATVTLRSWSPNPGYRVDEVHRGPAATTSVWFESDVADDVLVEVECVGGEPTATELPERDDHGGRNDGSGSGRSGTDYSSGSGSGRDHPEDD